MKCAVGGLEISNVLSIAYGNRDQGFMNCTFRHGILSNYKRKEKMNCAGLVICLSGAKT